MAAPQANAIAERVLRTLRRQWFDHLIIENERHPRMVLDEFDRRYDKARQRRALTI